MLYRFREAQEPGLGFGTRGDTQPRCGAWPALQNSGLKLKRGNPSSLTHCRRRRRRTRPAPRQHQSRSPS
ncbi:hypothetical protein K438DRAFT_1837727, partial [Mycena galopus ATCC 62051]